MHFFRFQLKQDLKKSKLTASEEDLLIEDLLIEDLLIEDISFAHSLLYKCYFERLPFARSH